MSEEKNQLKDRIYLIPEEDVKGYMKRYNKNKKQRERYAAKKIIK